VMVGSAVLVGAAWATPANSQQVAALATRQSKTRVRRAENTVIEELRLLDVDPSAARPPARFCGPMPL
jgi:hypothetical protein